MRAAGGGGQVLNWKECTWNIRKLENRMRVQDHPLKPPSFFSQAKNNEAQRGAVTCFKATELRGRQVHTSLPGCSSTLKKQTNMTTWAKHRQAPVIIREKISRGQPCTHCPSVPLPFLQPPPLCLCRELPLWIPLCVTGIKKIPQNLVLILPLLFILRLVISSLWALGFP